MANTTRDLIDRFMSMIKTQPAHYFLYRMGGLISDIIQKLLPCNTKDYHPIYLDFSHILIQIYRILLLQYLAREGIKQSPEMN